MRLSKKQKLYIFLCAFFLANAIVAEMIGVKIFSIEQTFGVPPAQINILGQKLDFNMSAGVLNWPIVFLISDVINEYFGARGVKFISYLTAGVLVFVFLIVYLSTLVSPAQFWLDLYSHDSAGNPLNINESYKLIFRQGLGIIIGSLVAFLVGQFLDAFIFHRLRRATSNRYIWLRATGSTIVSQLIDSFVVIYIAFYLFGPWSMEQIIAVGSINYIYKFIVALGLTPLLYVAHFFIDLYLGKSTAEELTHEAKEQQF